MIYFICMILLLILLVTLFKYVRNFTSPLFLLIIPWTLSFLLLVFSKFDCDYNSLSFIIILFGILLFIVGYSIPLKGKFDIRYAKNNTNVIGNTRLIRTIIFLELILLIISIIDITIFVSHNYIENFYFTLKYHSNLGTYQISAILSYTIIFTIAFLHLILFLYFHDEQFKKKKYLLIIQIAISSIASLLTLGRTSLMLLLISIIISFIIYTKPSQREILSLSMKILVIGAVIFSIYGALKYPYLLGQSSFLNVAKDQLTLYSSGSLVAFSNWIKLENDLLYGSNTFRIVFAIFEAIGYDTNVNKLVNEFIAISDVIETNVYTVFQFYARDFGLIYSLMIQFAFGCLHGFLYKKTRNFNSFWVYLYSLSTYPLIMQFFQDQYFSLSSTWIQFLFYGVVLYKLGIFFTKKENGG